MSCLWVTSPISYGCMWFSSSFIPILFHYFKTTVLNIDRINWTPAFSFNYTYGILSTCHKLKDRSHFFFKVPVPKDSFQYLRVCTITNLASWEQSPSIFLVKLKLGRWGWSTSEGALTSIAGIRSSRFSGNFRAPEISGRFGTGARELPVSFVPWWMAGGESAKSVWQFMPFPYVVKNIPGTRPRLKSIAKYSVSQSLTRCQWTAAYFGLW